MPKKVVKKKQVQPTQRRELRNAIRDMNDAIENIRDARRNVRRALRQLNNN